jgi:hypothetical protein
MSLCGERDGAVRPVLQIAIPRLPRIYARLKSHHPSDREDTSSLPSSKFELPHPGSGF